MIAGYPSTNDSCHYCGETIYPNSTHACRGVSSEALIENINPVWPEDKPKEKPKKGWHSKTFGKDKKNKKRRREL